MVLFSALETWLVILSMTNGTQKKRKLSAFSGYSLHKCAGIRDAMTRATNLQHGILNGTWSWELEEANVI